MLPISDAFRAALTSENASVDYGVDLLDDQDRPVEDISADVTSLSTRRDVYADVHGSCEVTLTRDLRWGGDRVRPWWSVNGHRWFGGVYLPTTPGQDAGEEPRTRQASGADKLWLLQRQVGDTYVVGAGISYLDAIRFALADAGVTGGLLLQGDRQGTPLEEPAVWVLLSDGTTWLKVINDLLSKIAYNGLWVDEQGRFRSEPYVNPRDRAPVWHFDTTDQFATVVGEDRNLSSDVYDQPNRWTFVRNMDREPTEGAGVYTVDRSGGAPFVRPRTVYVDAADQDALVAEGDRIVAEDTQNERVVTLALTTPLPLTHADVVTVHDPDLDLYGTRGLVRRWTLQDDGRMVVEVEVL